MNFKEYSLNEYIEHTLDAFAYRKDNLRKDITEKCDVHRTSTSSLQRYKGEVLTDVKCTKSHISIKYEKKYRYVKSYSEEKLVAVNIDYTKDILMNRIQRKSNDFYTKYYVKEEVTAYKHSKNGTFTFKENSVHKTYKINTPGTSYQEKYTAVSGKLVESCLANNKISVTMSKTLSGKIGKCRIKKFKDHKVLNFEIEGEPCILRLMNNTVVFNALMDTELGTYIEEVRELISAAFEDLKKVPVHSTGFILS